MVMRKVTPALSWFLTRSYSGEQPALLSRLGLALSQIGLPGFEQDFDDLLDRHRTAGEPSDEQVQQRISVGVLGIWTDVVWHETLEQIR